MSDRELKLQVVWSMLDKVTGPLKKIMGESSATAKALKATRDRLKELNEQQKQVGQFRELSAGLRAGSTRLQKAQQRVRELAQQMQAVQNPTRAMTREFDRATNKARAIKDANQQQSQQLQVLRDRLHEAGISTSNLGQHERTLRGNIAATNAQLSAQQQRLAAVTRQQERMAIARDRMNKTRATAGHVASAGVGAAVAGAAIGMPVNKALGEAKHYAAEVQRVGSLGLGDQVSADAVKFAAGMQTYGTSTLQNLELMRDAMTVFADEHHAEMVTPLLAKMKFANAAMYGDEKGADNDRKFMDMLKVIELRGGLSSQQAFANQANIVQQVLTATGGRVGPEEWLNVIKTGGLAAKGMKDDAFYYTMEPLVQEMGGFRVGTAMMSAYNNLYQGKTTRRTTRKLEEYGLIGDMSKVQHDKAGQLSFLNPGALLGADLFRDNQFAWMEQVLLPALAKKGITEKQQVLDAIGGIFSNRTASNLFGQMYLQREQIHKNTRLNQGADNIDTLHQRALQIPKGQELEAQAKLRDLQLEMGTQALPLYTRALEAGTNALKSINSFMKEHETIAKLTIVTLGVLAGILLVMGPLMLGLAALIGPFAILRFVMTAAGAKGLTLMPILRALGGAFRFAGTAVLWLGRALLMNPIGLAITAIALGALLIYQYWEPIKAFFTKLWDGVSVAFSGAWTAITGFASGLWAEVQAAFSGGIGGIAALILNWSPLGLFYQAFAGVLRWFGIELPAKFSEFGANILRGLVDGITGALGWVKDAVMGAGSSVIGWFKDKLGIKSPSRVFHQFGAFITEGLALGIGEGQDVPLQQVSGLAKRLAQLGAGIAIGAAGMPAMAFDALPPLAFDTRAPVAARGAAASYDSHDTIQIIIQPATGMDPQAIARAVAAELDRRDREKAARLRSSLHDY